MRTLTGILSLFLALLSLPVAAQQSQQFDDYTIHYNALNASLISPAVAKTYDIRRSDSRALVNIAILKNVDEQTVAMKARISVSARNLTGQNRQVEMREINEGDDAIYYIGELSVRNMETYRFKAMITPEGENKTYELKFEQQLYTE